MRDENIILDPGIGFAKTPEQNLEAMRNLEQLNVLGYPVLLRYFKKVIYWPCVRFASGGTS